MSIHIILEGNAHHGPKRANRKSIIRMFIDPLKKRLAEYLEFFKTKLLALPEKPLYLIGRQRLRNNWINLISVPIIQADALIGLRTLVDFPSFLPYFRSL
jgi:hypothetical protein